VLLGLDENGKPIWGTKNDLETRLSDIDLLVQLVKLMGLEFVGLAYDLEEKLGRKVDLATLDILHRSMEKPRTKHIASDIQRTLSYV